MTYKQIQQLEDFIKGNTKNNTFAQDFLELINQIDDEEIAENFNDIANVLGVTKQRVSAVYNDFFNNFYSDLYGKRGQKAIEDKRYLNEQDDDYISDEELEEDYRAYENFIEEMCQCGYASEEDFWDTNL